MTAHNAPQSEPSPKSDSEDTPFPSADSESELRSSGEGSGKGADAADEEMSQALEMSRLQAELEQANDRTLRSQAELENLRKRTGRELADERKYGSFGLVRDLLPVLDNVRRAVDATENIDDGSGLSDGVKMVEQQLKSTLALHQCVEIDALHQPFDPNFHEAILQQPSAEHVPGTVVLVTQVGYQMHDRVVRPSQVIVSTAPPDSESLDDSSR